jgi:hypothetical protein
VKVIQTYTPILEICGKIHKLLKKYRISKLRNVVEKKIQKITHILDDGASGVQLGDIERVIV